MAKLGNIFNKEEIKKRRAASTQNNQMDTLLKIKRKCRTVLSGT